MLIKLIEVIFFAIVEETDDWYGLARNILILANRCLFVLKMLHCPTANICWLHISLKGYVSNSSSASLESAGRPTGENAAHSTEKAVAYDLSVEGMCSQGDCVEVRNKLSCRAAAAGLVTGTGSLCSHTLSHKMTTAEKKARLVKGVSKQKSVLLASCKKAKKDRKMP